MDKPLAETSGEFLSIWIVSLFVFAYIYYTFGILSVGQPLWNCGAAGVCQ
jgi:hypothetical protein